MKIAICDDNVPQLQQFENTVQNFIRLKQPAHPVSIHTFTNGRDLFLFTQKYGAFDVVILDIIMPDLNGIELAAKLRAKGDNCRIIFLTSSPEFAVDSYKVKAYYYLLKGSAEAEIPRILNMVLDEIVEENTASVVIKEKGKWTRVPLSTIQYAESSNHTVYFHLHKSETITCFANLKDYNELLLADKRFVKCHKSYIVNMQHVKSITGKDFILGENVSVPISRNMYSVVKDAYFDYIFIK